MLFSGSANSKTHCHFGFLLLLFYFIRRTDSTWFWPASSWGLLVFFCFPFLFLLPGRLLKSLMEGDHTTLDGLAQEEPPSENGELDEKFSWTKHSVLFWIMDNFLPCVLRASTFRSNFDKSFPTNIWVVIHHSDIAFTLFVIQKDYDYCR